MGYNASVTISKARRPIAMSQLTPFKLVQDSTPSSAGSAPPLKTPADPAPPPRTPTNRAPPLGALASPSPSQTVGSELAPEGNVEPINAELVAPPNKARPLQYLVSRPVLTNLYCLKVSWQAAQIPRWKPCKVPFVLTPSGSYPSIVSMDILKLMLCIYTGDCIIQRGSKRGGPVTTV